jgi:nucleoside-diphosphate-sugar epimerase
MAMPDGVDALLTLAAAPREGLTRTAYNVRAFNPSAAEIQALVLQAFPDAEISFEVDVKRQRILDSWPADIDDTAARRDWNFLPTLDLHTAFDRYLIPAITATYRPDTTRERHT